MNWKHKILITAFSLALVPVLRAQFVPAKFIHLDTLANGTAWHFADWNGDGDTDILFASEKPEDPYSNNWMLVWMEGDGAGHFAAPRMWEETVYREFFLGDMNGDGSPDLVFHPENSQNVVWRANLGGVPGALVPVSTDAFFIAAVLDWDGDGDNDVVEHGRWVENAGLGFFTNYHPIVTQGFYYGPIADLNADGRLDFLSISTTSAGLHYLRQSLDGAFADTIVIDPVLFSVDNFSATDMNADGHLDVVVYHTNSNNQRTCYWYANNGTGQFGPRMEIIDAAFQTEIALKTAPVDFDSDGLPDIACYIFDTTEQRAYFAWFRNLGSGQFDLQTTDMLLLNDYMQVQDITGDGAKDILFNTGALLVAVNQGNNTYAETASIYPHAAGAGGIDAVDVDTDGDADICFYSPLTGNVGWWPNDGAGHFGPVRVMDRIDRTVDNFFANNRFIKCADLDGDGWNDLILNTGTVGYVWLGTGNGEFAEPDTFSMNTFFFAGYTIRAHVLADADDDGDLDVVNTIPDITSWYPNDGSGAFGAVITDIPASYDDGSDCYGDLDGDGDGDLLYHIYESPGFSSSVYWKSNLGDGIYGANQLIVNYPNPVAQIYYVHPCARDMDNDGDMDVIVATGSWYENDGTGHGWAPHEQFYYPSVNSFIIPADFDNDSDCDIFYVTNAGSFNFPPIPNIALLFVNDGIGAFPELFDWITQISDWQPISATAADLDQDGDLDVLFNRQGVVGWLENVATVPPIQARVFFDENGNGVQDSVDAPMPGVGLRLDPEEIVAFTDEEGLARFYVDTGTYQITYLPDDCRLLSTDSTVYTVEMPYQGPARLFGFRPDSTQIGMEARLTSAPTRCGFVVPFWAGVRNTGCTTKPATFVLRLPSLAGLVSADVGPDLIQGDSLIWQFTDPLLPGETRYVYLQLQMPGPDHLGETLHITGSAWPTDAPDLAGTLDFSSIINCSYDPNDKLVNHAVVPVDYEPTTSELVYTIRFQNTGTDTAFTVAMRDTLDTLLDWVTFRPLGASHPFEAGIDLGTGEVVFHFHPIELPDSNVNEISSHGYAQFAIRLKSGLPPGTHVFNTAAIYFDFNPPVFTNTVETKVQAPVSVLPELGQGWQVFLSPNPNDGDFSIDLPVPAVPGMTFRLTDLTGRLLLEKTMETGSRKQSMRAGNTTAGLYFLQIVWKEKVLATAKFVKQ